MKTRYTTGVRRYLLDGAFSHDITFHHAEEGAAVTDACFTVEEINIIESLFPDPVYLPALPTNVYVRGPNGRFVKWSNV